MTEVSDYESSELVEKFKEFRGNFTNSLKTKGINSIVDKKRTYYCDKILLGFLTLLVMFLGKFYEQIFDYINFYVEVSLITYFLMWILFFIGPNLFIHTLLKREQVSIKDKYWIIEEYENFKKNYDWLKDEIKEKRFLLLFKLYLEKEGTNSNIYIDYFLVPPKTSSIYRKMFYDIFVGSGFFLSLFAFIYNVLMNNNVELLTFVLKKSSFVFLVMLISRLLVIIYLILFYNLDKSREDKVIYEGISLLYENL